MILRATDAAMLDTHRSVRLAGHLQLWHDQELRISALHLPI
jgi:hypothetical protein